MTTEPKNLPPSCAALAAQLIVEGCLPIIQGTVKGKTPIEGVPLSPQERNKLGLTGRGLTVFYPAGKEGVFFDMGKNTFIVWFTGDDYEKATPALHDALMRAFPSARQLDDVPSKQNSKMRARVYRVELSGGRLAGIETSFWRSSGKTKFMAKIAAQKRP